MEFTMQGLTFRIYAKREAGDIIHKICRILKCAATIFLHDITSLNQRLCFDVFLGKSLHTTCSARSIDYRSRGMNVKLRLKYKFCLPHAVHQFIHQLCHTLCRGKLQEDDYHMYCSSRAVWFEELLCETAALFVLIRMGREREICLEYARTIERKCASSSFAEWYKTNKADLGKTGTIMQKAYLRHRQHICKILQEPAFNHFLGLFNNECSWNDVIALNDWWTPHKDTDELESILQCLPHSKFKEQIVGLLHYYEVPYDKNAKLVHGNYHHHKINIYSFLFSYNIVKTTGSQRQKKLNLNMTQ